MTGAFHDAVSDSGPLGSPWGYLDLCKYKNLIQNE
jgi:hypothetical protein